MRAINNQTSIALFATAWTLENLDSLDFAINEARFWIDSSISVSLPHVDGEAPTTYPDADDLGCISDFVSARPAALSSTGEFYTNFDTGFGESWFIEGKCVSRNPWAHLSRQSIPPSFSLRQTQRVAGLKVNVEHVAPYCGGSNLGVYVPSLQGEVEIPLYKFNHFYETNMKLFVVVKSTDAFTIAVLFEDHCQTFKVEPSNDYTTSNWSLDSGRLLKLSLHVEDLLNCEIKVGSIAITHGIIPLATVPEITIANNVDGRGHLDWSCIGSIKAYSGNVFLNGEWSGISNNTCHLLSIELEPNDIIIVELFDFCNTHIYSLIF